MYKYPKIKIEIGTSVDAIIEKAKRNSAIDYKTPDKPFAVFFFRREYQGVPTYFLNLDQVHKLVSRMMKLGAKAEPEFYPSGTVEYHLWIQD